MNTLCWNCSKPYAMTAQVCPHCSAANANADLGAASAQAEGGVVVIPPEQREEPYEALCRIAHEQCSGANPV